MERFGLTDGQWAKMEPHCLGKPTDPGRSGGDNRLFVEAVLWIVRTGSPWRDLPKVFGKWNTVFKRYRDWVKGDVFVRLFEACSDEPDMEYAMIDATIVKVHRHGQGVALLPANHDVTGSGNPRQSQLSSLSAIRISRYAALHVQLPLQRRRHQV
jgi:transposase